MIIMFVSILWHGLHFFLMSDCKLSPFLNLEIIYSKLLYGLSIWVWNTFKHTSLKVVYTFCRWHQSHYKLSNNHKYIMYVLSWRILKQFLETLNSAKVAQYSSKHQPIFWHLLSGYFGNRRQLSWGCDGLYAYECKFFGFFYMWVIYCILQVICQMSTACELLPEIQVILFHLLVQTGLETWLRGSNLTSSNWKCWFYRENRRCFFTL